MNNFNQFTPVDGVEILILIDNVSDTLSSTRSTEDSEIVLGMKRGLKTLSSRCMCCAVHGFSCLVTAYRGNDKHIVLFDSGPEDYAFERNVSRLGAPLEAVESIVLSHGHWDHAGAMRAALQAITLASGRRDIPFYAHPGMFSKRGMRLPNGEVLPMDNVPSIEELTQWGAAVVLSKEPIFLLDDMYYVSGEIPRTTTFERGLPGHVRRTENGFDWEPDELILDERWLGINVQGKGLVVFSACSHAGIINVLNNARQVQGDIPIHSVFGGFHLSGVNESIIPQTIDGMSKFNLKTIAPGHCTGWRGLSAMCHQFGYEVLSPTAVGKRYQINAEV